MAGLVGRGKHAAHGGGVWPPLAAYHVRRTCLNAVRTRNACRQGAGGGKVLASGKVTLRVARLAPVRLPLSQKRPPCPQCPSLL